MLLLMTMLITTCCIIYASDNNPNAQCYASQIVDSTKSITIKNSTPRLIRVGLYKSNPSAKLLAIQANTAAILNSNTSTNRAFWIQIRYTYRWDKSYVNAITYTYIPSNSSFEELTYYMDKKTERLTVRRPKKEINKSHSFDSPIEKDKKTYTFNINAAIFFPKTHPTYMPKQVKVPNTDLFLKKWIGILKSKHTPEKSINAKPLKISNITVHPITVIIQYIQESTFTFKSIFIPKGQSYTCNFDVLTNQGFWIPIMHGEHAERLTSIYIPANSSLKELTCYMNRQTESLSIKNTRKNSR